MARRPSLYRRSNPAIPVLKAKWSSIGRSFGGRSPIVRHRPTIGLRPPKLRPIDDHFAFSTGMAGFERLYKDGRLAVVHGCGYDNPSFSHFTSMAYWHTAAPNRGDEYGWIGRLADGLRPGGASNFVVN